MHDAQNKITALTRQLTKCWRDTKERWFDKKTVEFEKRHLDALLPAVGRTVLKMGKLEKMIERIKKDCEYDERS